MDLDLLYEGYLFNVHERYAGNLAFIFVTLLYSGVIPFLLPLMCLYFIIRYWTDKVIFFYFSQKPPRYDKTMHTLVCKYMPYALYFHLCFNIWAYGVDSVFPTRDYQVTDENTGNTAYYYRSNGLWDRLTSSLGLPMLIMMIVAFLVHFTEQLTMKFLF